MQRRATLERHIVEVVVHRGRLRTGALRLTVRRGGDVRGLAPRGAEVDLVGHDVQTATRRAILAGVVSMGESADDGDPRTLEEIALQRFATRSKERDGVPVSVLRPLLAAALVVRGRHAEREERLAPWG